MATTVVACAIRYDQAIVSHVGDSRCCWCAIGGRDEITQDHTLVNEQRKVGLISAEEIATSDSRHVLLRSLGPEMFVSPDTVAVSLQAGDTRWSCARTACTTEMKDEEIARIVSQKRTADEPGSLNWSARGVEIDGGDNTTAQQVKYAMRSVEQVAMYRGRPYRLPA